jgi:cytochrome c2
MHAVALNGLLCVFALAACDDARRLPEAAQRGRIALHQHACHSCHVIPGIVGSNPQVGPPLTGFARRQLIAGRLPNTRDNLVAWIREPQRLDPASAMPSMSVNAADAHDMAAYLEQLE